VPAWWRDAKLGVFVHWTPASVPAFAPTDAEIGELLVAGRRDALAYSPYTEWYENSLRFPDSPVARHHAATYPGRAYRSFAADWEAALQGWDPDDWARRFAATGARYVVLVAKHHDGYCLWPSQVANPHAPGFRCRRDVVGELAEAVRARGLRFGVYYSGGLDWTFDDRPIGTFADLLRAQPRGDYPAYAEAQVRELIDRYRPAVLWNDISWPAPLRRLHRLLDDYQAAVPDGVVNDRFMPRSALLDLARTRPLGALVDRAVAAGARRGSGVVPPRPPRFDVRTPEYTTFPDVQATPWECVRGIDRSFGYNRASTEADHLSRRDLTWMLVDVAATGGNLLLNVGPRGEDARIPPLQLERLDWLAALTATGGEALFATRPWVRPGRGAGPAAEVRHLARDRDLFAWVRAARPGSAVREVSLAEVAAGPATTARRLDTGAELALEATADGARITLDPPAGDLPVPIRLRDAAAAPSR
jgi:alpha-L-fucosidase